jgi:aspartyl-tRNA(Asn)/glutamyl-tRNA(Gln) amidotransferase subunit B
MSRSGETLPPPAALDGPPARVSDFEPVIGLEIHVQLKTRTKLFCGNENQFGAEPNAHVCPVCLGLPGALPVLNRAAVELAVRAALGLHCSVHERSIFARKNYFYPDLPKGYQISQFEHPFASDGYVEVPGPDQGRGRRIRIRRIHMEEDAGKSLHDRIPAATAVDLNRTGVPLIEIVTEPDVESPSEARAFLTRLKQALEYLDVSDCNMEEGSLRVDANVSVRRPGDPLGTKTEVKNMNSFSNVERALIFEIDRQRDPTRTGGAGCSRDPAVGCEPWRGAPDAQQGGESRLRYFPDPDLPVLEIGAAWLERIRGSVPEMPWARAARFGRGYQLSAEHAEQLTASRDVADYFEGVVSAGATPPEAASWVMGDVLAAVNVERSAIGEFRIRPTDLAGLLELVRSGQISRPIARRVFAKMKETGRPAAAIVEEEGLSQIRDESALSRWVTEVIKANPEAVERFRAGDAKLMGFFVGQVMKLSLGKADPKEVSELVRRMIAS